MNKILLLSALLLTTSATVVNDLRASMPEMAVGDSSMDDRFLNAYYKIQANLDATYEKNMTSLRQKSARQQNKISVDDLNAFIKAFSTYKGRVILVADTMAGKISDASIAESISSQKNAQVKSLDNSFYSDCTTLLKIVLQNITQPAIERMKKAKYAGEKDVLARLFLSKINSIRELLSETGLNGVMNKDWVPFSETFETLVYPEQTKVENAARSRSVVAAEAARLAESARNKASYQQADAKAQAALEEAQREHMRLTTDVARNLSSDEERTERNKAYTERMAERAKQFKEELARQAEQDALQDALQRAQRHAAHQEELNKNVTAIIEQEEIDKINRMNAHFKSLFSNQTTADRVNFLKEILIRTARQTDIGLINSAANARLAEINRE